jgi:hypothetical protein
MHRHRQRHVAGNDLRQRAHAARTYTTNDPEHETPTHCGLQGSLLVKWLDHPDGAGVHVEPFVVLAM